MLKQILLTITALTLAASLPTVAQAAKAKKADKGNRPGKIVRQYDTNSNGTIDGAEIEAVKKAYTAEPNGALKQFDTNNDGKLDDTEIGAMKGHKKGKDKNKKKVAA